MIYDTNIWYGIPYDSMEASITSFTCPACKKNFFEVDSYLGLKHVIICKLDQLDKYSLIELEQRLDTALENMNRRWRPQHTGTLPKGWA